MVNYDGDLYMMVIYDEYIYYIWVNYSGYYFIIMVKI